MEKLTVTQALLRANGCLARGETSEAQLLYNLILNAFPHNKEAQQGIIKVTEQSGSAENINPPKNLINKLESLYNQKQYSLATKLALNLTLQHPRAFIVWNILGAALNEIGQSENALKAFERAVDLNPEFAEGFNNIGIIKKDKFELDAAILYFTKATSLKPTYATAHNNLGNALKDQGDVDAAIKCYEKAVQLNPDDAAAYNNLGVAFKDKGNLDAAIGAYQKALLIKPNHQGAHQNIGNALRNKGELISAIEAYKKVLSLNPNNAAIETQLLHLQTHICDFSIFPHLKDASSRLGITTSAVPTFATLSWVDNAKEQYLRSQKWASEKYNQKQLPQPVPPSLRPKRIKVGYFSADFHDHATMYLMAGLLREHQTNDFEIFAFSYGHRKEDRLSKKVEENVEHFFNVTDYSEKQIASFAHSHSLDIAIDLKGYTTNSRSGFFQYRVAPIQMNYLGYPGTMAADFIDYIIADPYVIPYCQREYYSEKVIYLPHTYQPNDDMREIASTHTTRSDYGLPEDCFVFCCFNNSYKISPHEWDIWMQILKKVEGSVLWLLHSNKWVEQNLREEARLRGVSPVRLVFAKKVNHAEHLARQKHADLFLDTFNVNAHTTASDALWGGLPVITKRGKQFAARVATSLLHAIGLPELITETDVDYQRLILELATQPEKLAAVKAKLVRNRLSEPLFETKRYTRNFERGLKTAYDVYFERKAPMDIWVTENEV